MVNSVGKKLQQARIAKQLSVEEAARVTRIRPDKLIDLEEDNYANFPSMSYAKGFLLLYARFLGVDVHEFADSLHTPNPVSTDDYEYLNAGASPAPTPTARRPYHFSPRRQHTILPVVVFGFLAVAIVLAVYLIVTFQRLGPLDDLTAEKKDNSSPGASPAISTVAAQPARPPAPVHIASTPLPTLRNTPPALIAAPPIPVPLTTPPVAAVSPSPAEHLPTPVPAGTFDPTREVRRAEPVVPTPPGHTAITPVLPSIGAGPDVTSVVPAATPVPLKRISIRPIRKTWVTIRRDVAGSTPLFQDWLYPGDGPLKLSGHKFWITVKDPTAVQITQDGQPLSPGQSDIAIE
jgi:cytoskeletal protein RodZ